MEKEPLKHNGAGGRLRDTYMVGPEKDHVAKIPKEGVVKHYPFGSVTYPTALYTLLKFGKANVNEADYANYKALPEAVRKEFTPSIRMIQGVVVQERVMDYDGAPSLSMSEHQERFGRIKSELFWKKIDELKEIFLAGEPLLGVFYKGSNIMVKKLSDEEWIPVLIDYKRLGARAYIFQPNLNLNSELRKKFLRQFERFEKEFRPES